MGDFDKLLKANIEQIILALSGKYLGFEIERYERIPEKLQLSEREVDFAAIVDTPAGERFILHLEFQVQDDPEMLLRMAEYHGIWLRNHDLPIRHYVLYLGEQRPRMKVELGEDKVFKDFTLINLHDVKPEKILASNLPEEVMLAILGDFAIEQAQVVVDNTLWRLGELSRDHESLKRYIKQLRILSRLRKLEMLTEKLTNRMPITYDVKADGLYLKGLAEGKIRRNIAHIQRIAAHFPDYSAAQIAQLLDVELSLVERVLGGQLVTDEEE